MRILRYLNLGIFGLERNKFMDICEHCGGEYTKRRPHQKFCCKRCSEKHWIQQNPERDKYLKKKSWLKCNVVACRQCGKPIPTELRASGVTMCSDSCRHTRKRILENRKRQKRIKLFLEHKERRGCCICGYNKFGGSLDFHHVNPNEKERRIESKHWSANSDIIKKELEKCIMVCKNCHYELHYIFRKDAEEYWEIIERVRASPSK